VDFAAIIKDETTVQIGALRDLINIDFRQPSNASKEAAQAI
jgi:hypothetical protein